MIEGRVAGSGADGDANAAAVVTPAAAEIAATAVAVAAAASVSREAMQDEGLPSCSLWRSFPPSDPPLVLSTLPSLPAQLPAPKPAALAASL